MKSFLLYICFCLTFWTSFGQNIDSILTEIENTTSHEELAYLHSQCGMYYDTVDRPKSIYHRKKSADYYMKTGDLNQTVIKFSNVAHHFTHLSQMDSAAFYFEKSIQLIPKLDSFDTELMCYINLADICSNLKEHERAIKLINECHELAKLHSIDSMRIVALVRKGREFRRLGKIEKSQSTYQKALIQSKKLSFHNLTAGIYNNIAVIHKSNNDYKKSLQYIDSAEAKLDKIDLQAKVTLSFNRGKNYTLLKEFSMAISYFLECEKLLLEDSLGRSWKKLYLMTTFKELSNIFEIQKNYEKSLFYSKKVYELSIEIAEINKKNEILKLSEQFESEKRQQQIKNLEKINIEKDKLHSAEKKRNWLITGFVIVILILLIIFILVNNRSRKKVNESEKQVLQKSAILEGQEMERKRLSQDLHDGLGSTLASIKLNLESNSKVKKEIIEEVQRACDETRFISHALAGKKDRSFSQQIEGIFAPFKNEFIIVIDAFPEKELDDINPLIQSDIRFILKECLNNALKHSSAEKIEIHLFITENTLMVLFEDNGVGMNRDKTNGIGISNIRDRIKKYNGKFSLESKVGFGTSYHISIPLI